MQKNRSSDGKKILLEIMHEQQKFHARNGAYTTDLVSGGDTGLTYDDPNSDGTVPSENEFYLVTASVCDGSTSISDCVLLTAAAGVDNDVDLSYNSRNVKTPAAHW